MKKLLVVLLLASCNSGDVKPTFADTIKREQMKDSIIKKVYEDANSNALKQDTINAKEAPVKITSSKVLDGETGRVIWVFYKNVSKKKITAIRFKWYLVNAFNEPIDNGNSMIKGFDGGYSETELLPGKTENSEWDVPHTAKKAIATYPTEVAFADGSNWKIK